MIRVKLLSEGEYDALCKEKRCRPYVETAFYWLLKEKGDFSDAESLALLRHLHGDAFVEGQWYRSTTAEGKPCLPAISREAMYGLVVLENSRNGLYTDIRKEFIGFERGVRLLESFVRSHHMPLVWQAFANMEQDILLIFRKKDLDFSWDIGLDVEFILEDYPINGEPTDVHVVDGHLREPEQREGAWYISDFFYDDQYTWTGDLRGILDVLREELIGRPPLAAGIFSLERFEVMCGSTEDEPLPDEEEASPWRVVNHMAYLPQSGDSRRLLYLTVEEDREGRFCLGSRISVKYPSYQEMLREAQELKRPGWELFMVPVDVNECMGCAADIRRALCAFRVTADVVETFGPEEGLREFEGLLRRVSESGYHSPEPER